MSILPPIIEDLAATVPIEALLKLVRARGGQVVWIPAPDGFGPDNWLAECMGYDAALALVRRFDGDFFAVPRCAAALQAERDRAILAARQTLTRNQCAAQFGVTWRTVSSASRRAERHGDAGDDPHPDLFADL